MRCIRNACPSFTPLPPSPVFQRRHFQQRHAYLGCNGLKPRKHNQNLRLGNLAWCHCKWNKTKAGVYQRQDNSYSHASFCYWKPNNGLRKKNSWTCAPIAAQLSEFVQRERLKLRTRPGGAGDRSRRDILILTVLKMIVPWRHKLKQNEN